MAEKLTKQFYSRIKKETSRSMETIKDYIRQVQMEPGRVLKTVIIYYNSLYNRKAVNAKTRIKIFSYFTKKISDIQTNKLIRPISIQKIKIFIKKAASGKSPGINGLSYKLYKIFIKVVTKKKKIIIDNNYSIETFYKDLGKKTIR